MSQMLDLDDFPIGTLARTPSGRIGIVIKHKGAASKQDHFQRLVLHFSSDPHDSVTLQPNMLDPITPCTSGRALVAQPSVQSPGPSAEVLSKVQRLLAPAGMVGGVLAGAE